MPRECTNPTDLPAVIDIATMLTLALYEARKATCPRCEGSGEGTPSVPCTVQNAVERLDRHRFARVEKIGAAKGYLARYAHVPGMSFETWLTSTEAGRALLARRREESAPYAPGVWVDPLTVVASDEAADLGRAMREGVKAQSETHESDSAESLRAQYDGLRREVCRALGNSPGQDPLAAARDVARENLEMRSRITMLESTAMRERAEFRQELGALTSGVLRALGAAQHDDVLWAARQAANHRSDALAAATTAQERCARAEERVRRMDAENEVARAALGATDNESLIDAARRVTLHLATVEDLARVGVVTADAARAAGWKGEAGTGAELVAAVRRGAMDAVRAEIGQACLSAPAEEIDLRRQHAMLLGEREAVWSACAADLCARAEEIDLSAGQTDDDDEHAALCARAESLRSAAAWLQRMQGGGV